YFIDTCFSPVLKYKCIKHRGGNIMNKKFLQSLMKMAHSIARNMEGHYSVRIKIGMMQAWKILKNSMPKTSPKAVTTEAMKKPATKKDRPLFYELSYTVKSAKMWTKHGKHR